jgi:hypothetical protein
MTFGWLQLGALLRTTAIITMTMAAVAGGWWVGWGRAQPNQATNSNEASSSNHYHDNGSNSNPYHDNGSNSNAC